MQVSVVFPMSWKRGSYAHGKQWKYARFRYFLFCLHSAIIASDLDDTYSFTQPEPQCHTMPMGVGGLVETDNAIMPCRKEPFSWDKITQLKKSAVNYRLITFWKGTLAGDYYSPT